MSLEYRIDDDNQYQTTQVVPDKLIGLKYTKLQTSDNSKQLLVCLICQKAKPCYDRNQDLLTPLVVHTWQL